MTFDFAVQQMVSDLEEYRDNQLVQETDDGFVVTNVMAGDRTALLDGYGPHDTADVLVKAILYQTLGQQLTFDEYSLVAAISEDLEKPYTTTLTYDLANRPEEYYKADVELTVDETHLGVLLASEFRTTVDRRKEMDIPSSRCTTYITNEYLQL